MTEGVVLGTRQLLIISKNFPVRIIFISLGKSSEELLNFMEKISYATYLEKKFFTGAKWL